MKQLCRYLKFPTIHIKTTILLSKMGVYVNYIITIELSSNGSVVSDAIKNDLTLYYPYFGKAFQNSALL